MNTKHSEHDNIIIIGNGFDINLDLPTKYTDFMDSEFFQSFYENGGYLGEHLKQKRNLQRWIDIENELKVFSNLHKVKVANLFNDFNLLKLELKNYLSSIDTSTINFNHPVIAMLREAANSATLIIDFNYTDTVQQIYSYLDIDTESPSSNIEHVKIHGTLDQTNLILGVEDNANILLEHTFLKKSTNQNFSSINFNRALKNTENLIIYGHSLGETDHLYFDQFFKNRSEEKHLGDIVNITIYHYGINSYNQLFEQISIMNSNQIIELKQNNNLTFIDNEEQS